MEKRKALRILRNEHKGLLHQCRCLEKTEKEKGVKIDQNKRPRNVFTDDVGAGGSIKPVSTRTRGNC